MFWAQINQIINKELFRVLKEKYGDGYQEFMLSKLCAVSGDIRQDNLGIHDSNLKEAMCNEINIVVNVAANTTFDERYMYIGIVSRDQS